MQPVWYLYSSHVPSPDSLHVLIQVVYKSNLDCESFFKHRYNLASLEMANSQAGGMKGYWKCALAVFLVSMSPFQYGVDFGLIGGVQAMVGFLEVCYRCL